MSSKDLETWLNLDSRLFVAANAFSQSPNSCCRIGETSQVFKLSNRSFSNNQDHWLGFLEGRFSCRFPFPIFLIQGKSLRYPRNVTQERNCTICAASIDNACSSRNER